MWVKVNGHKVELEEGSTIRDAIEISNAPYSEDCILGVIKGEEEFEKHITKYKIITNKGSIILEMSPQEQAQELVKIWRENHKKFEKLFIRWETSTEVAIGPIKTDLKPIKNEFNYQKGDVILSLSGFSAESTHIILSKEDHAAVYGVPDINQGVFARIIGGRRTLFNLVSRDVVTAVEPVIERKSIIKSAGITNLDTKLEEGNQLFTYVQVSPTVKSPQSVEHFFSLIEDGKAKVDYESNSFLGLYALQGIKKDEEYIDQRKRGAVTLRNSGKGKGKVYIYRENRVSNPSHNLIGHVEQGMELLDIVKEEDNVTLISEPGRIMNLSKTQEEAESFVEQYGIQQIREGNTDDDAIIVEQDPQYTIEILKEKKVKTYGISKEKLVGIKFRKDTPRTKWYFKKISGLLDYPIGSIKVHFAFPGMKVMMFEGDSNEAKGLIQENIPEDCVKTGELGITNMSRRHTGMIGVRFEDNDEYGPTGEPFNGTNIIGEIVEGLNYLENCKEGDIVYVREIRS